MLPEIWLPTCTFTTGLSVPVAVTAWVMAPRVTGAVWYSLVPSPPQPRKARSPSEDEHDSAADENVSFHEKMPTNWRPHGID